MLISESYSAIFMSPQSVYTHGIYAEGYIVFVFPFICLFIHPFVISSCSWNYFNVLH